MAGAILSYDVCRGTEIERGLSMYFPPFGAFVGHHLFFLPGVVFFVFGLVGIMTAIQDKRTRRKPFIDEKTFYFILGLLFFGGINVVMLLSDSIQYATQRIELERITEIRVERIRGENGPAVGNAVILTDPSLFMSGMKALSTADPHLHPKGESFSDGYRIFVRYEDEDSYLPVSILAYRRSNMSRNAADVVVMSDGDPSIIDEYDCKAFHDWIRTSIDPLFDD
jgi:hypothetical protein